jgi:hypothetical protein
MGKNHWQHELWSEWDRGLGLCIPMMLSRNALVPLRTTLGDGNVTGAAPLASPSSAPAARRLRIFKRLSMLAARSGYARGTWGVSSRNLPAYRCGALQHRLAVCLSTVPSHHHLFVDLRG